MRDSAMSSSTSLHPGIKVVFNSKHGPGVYDESSSSWRYKYTKYTTEERIENPNWRPEDEPKVLPEVLKMTGPSSEELAEFVKGAFNLSGFFGDHTMTIEVLVYVVVEVSIETTPKRITLRSNDGEVRFDITNTQDYGNLHTNFSKGDPVFSFTVSSTDLSFPSINKEGFHGIDSIKSFTRFVCRNTDKTQFPTLWKYPYYAILS